MKKFVPLKYILGMILIFFVIPITILLSIVFVVGMKSDLAIGVSIFCGAVILILGPYACVKNQENSSLIITKDKIMNYINDGTLNFGWEEDIVKVRSIKIVGNKEVQKYFKNCRAKKALLIDFGGCNIKYVAVSLFTNKQIDRIIQCIQRKQKQIIFSI